MKKALEKFYLVNLYILLLVGFFSFLRFTEASDLFIPRKILKVFSNYKALDSFSFLTYLSKGSEPILIGKDIGPKQSLSFALYFKDFQFFDNSNYGEAKTIILKEKRSLENYNLLITTDYYKFYEKK